MSDGIIELKPFESTICVPAIGVEPELAGAAITHVIRRAVGTSHVRVSNVQVTRNSIIVLGDADPGALQVLMASLGQELMAMKRLTQVNVQARGILPEGEEG